MSKAQNGHLGSTLIFNGETAFETLCFRGDPDLAFIYKKLHCNRVQFCQKTALKDNRQSAPEAALLFDEHQLRVVFLCPCVV